MKYLYLIPVTLILLGIGELYYQKKSKAVTSTEDYNTYLTITANPNLDRIQKENLFWKEKFQKSPNQTSYLLTLAGTHTQWFEATGDVHQLLKADSLLTIANVRTKYKKSGWLRAQARNYISQHRFAEAQELLCKAEVLGEKKRDTQKMLFDVYLELGNDTEAYVYLEEISKKNDFDYAIRLSKWNDHTGDLTEAIRILEQTLPYVETSSDGLKLWTYSNLADYYGHAGLINKSYAYYLKALAINPQYTYALKGIAWIVFSKEQNSQEALRILDAIEQTYSSPDLFLLKAEIAEFEGKTEYKNDQIQKYTDYTRSRPYGAMYNKYDVLLQAENESTYEDAITLAQEEIEHRPTVQSYDLLAWAYYRSGQIEKAFHIASTQVVGQTSEPEVLYHLAHILKASNQQEKVDLLKEELLASSYELGPVASATIQQL